MAYLFGDSTPFPYDFDFVSTVSDLTDAAVALLRVDEQVAAADDRFEEVRAAVAADQAALDALIHAVRGLPDAVLAGDASNHVHDVAGRAGQAACRAIEQGKTDAASRQEQALREHQAAVGGASAGVRAALEGFLAKHELPGGTSRLWWRGGIGDAYSRAEVSLALPWGLAAVLDVVFPPSHAYRKMIRVGDLERGLGLQLPAAAGLLRKRPELKRQSLDSFFLAEVTLAAEEAALVLRRSNRHPSPGILIRLPTGKRCSAGWVGEGETKGETELLDGEDTASAARLLDLIAPTLRELQARRGGLVKASFLDRSIDELGRPFPLAAALVDAVGPIVREMRRRAPRGELVLKRDLGGGRREELFVTRAELVRKFADLSPDRRELFEAFGLEGTGEVVLSPELLIEEDISFDDDDAPTQARSGPEGG